MYEIGQHVVSTIQVFLQIAEVLKQHNFQQICNYWKEPSIQLVYSFSKLSYYIQFEVAYFPILTFYLSN